MANYHNTGLPSTSTLEGSHETDSASFDRPCGLGMAEEDEKFLDADVHWAGLAKPFRLRQATVMCLIFNRMIGTGIFRTPATVFKYTGSVGISMLWWCLGAIVGMAGILVYMELGLTLPLYRFDGVEISVPRSGGELNYLKYIFEKPRFFTTCVFGIAFILLGNVATNSISFGMSLLDAAGKSDIKNYDEIVRAIAIGVATFSCIIHGLWRQGGIYLNNILAAMKILILLMIFIIGLLAYGGVFGKTLVSNGALKSSSTFSGGKADAYGYAESFLSILFAWGGFNQANYVMGEVDDPRRRYKWPAFSAVAIVSILYLLVNVAYFIVVPEDAFQSGITKNVAHKFFELTLGSLNSNWAPKAPQMLSAFMAISSLGNIIVMTYTAARVKQEIAKEGILPARRFLAGSMKSIRIPRFWRAKKESLPEDIPLGALVLHLSMSILLILGTWKLASQTTYGLLVDLYSYSIDAVFGAFLGFGLLYMRLFSRRGWAEYSRASGFRVSPFVSCVSAAIFGIANLYPVAAKWAPPKVLTALTTPWYTTGVVGWSIMACGVIWWAGFRFVVPHIGRDHKGRYLLVTRKLWFHAENDYKVLEYEDIDFRWPPKDEGMEETLQEETYNADPAEVSARRHRDHRDRRYSE